MAKTTIRTRLVLVDDHEDSLEAFSILLGEKYALCGYTSAAAALQALDAAKPDVLLLDIGMQPVDGLQCLAMIRATPGYRDIPAVAVTGFARDVERERFLAGGFQAVVVKPVLDHGELMAVVDRLANPTVSAALPTSAHPGAASALPSASTAAAGLDGRLAMRASPGGGSDETDGQETVRPHENAR